MRTRSIDLASRAVRLYVRQKLQPKFAKQSRRHHHEVQLRELVSRSEHPLLCRCYLPGLHHIDDQPDGAAGFTQGS